MVFLKSRYYLVDKLFGLWISGKLMVDFVAGVHNTGVIAAT